MPVIDQAKLEQLRAHLAASPHARAAQQFFSAPAGQALMAHLEREFVFGDLLGATPEETAFNLGARETVLLLRRLRDLSERTGQDVDLQS